MASGPIISWEIKGENVEIVSDFIFLGSKITAVSDCNHEIKRHLLLGWEDLLEEDKSRECIKKRRHYFVYKHVYSQSYGFCSSLVLMGDLDNKNTEYQRCDAFKLWCCRRLLKVPWIARRPNQSILKEIKL